MKLLQTARLYLRNFRCADAVILFDYRNDIRCNRYQRYDDTSMVYLQNFVQDFSHCMFLSKEDEQHYAIISNASCEMMGDISIFFSESDNCFTLGITIAPAFQKQGYAYEILKEVTEQLQTTYPSVDIVALIEKGNTESISLFRKLGFNEECYAESIKSYVYTLPNRENDHV